MWKATFSGETLFASTPIPLLPFAPVARHGGNMRERQGDRYRVESRHINTFEGLSELEASLPPTVAIPTVRQAQSQRRTMVRVLCGARRHARCRARQRER